MERGGDLSLMLVKSISISSMLRGPGGRSGWLSIVTGICTEVVVAVVGGGRGEGKAQGVKGQLSSSCCGCCCKEAWLTGVVRFEPTVVVGLWIKSGQPMASGEKIELFGVLPVEEDVDVVDVDVEASEEEDAE